MPLNLNQVTEGQILLFALIFMRMIAFIVSSAVFGSTTVSTQIKILLSVALSVLIYPILKVPQSELVLIADNTVAFTVREILIGVTLGLLTRLFFFVVSMAGDLIAMSMGLSSAQMFNPMLGSHGNSMEQFHATIGTLVFLALNGHHLLLSGIFQSYELMPMIHHNLNLGVFAEISVIIQKLFIITIKMSAPILISILLTNISMGILGRAVPQMNVLVTGMPLTIIIGFIVMFVSMPLYVMEMTQVIDLTSVELFKVMKGL